jgi:hypothetical protein
MASVGDWSTLETAHERINAAIARFNKKQTS